MPSFFKRPTWANVGGEDSRPDFYRRSDQTYGDVISFGQGERKTADQATAPEVDDGKIAIFLISLYSTRAHAFYSLNTWETND